MPAKRDTRFLEALRIRGYPSLLLLNAAIWAAWIAELIAHGWLVLQLTDSPFWVGAAVASRGSSQFVFSLFGGAITDRMDLRRLLVITNTTSAAIAGAISLLVVTDRVEVWHVLVAMVWGGAASGINGPAYNALIFHVVGPANLLNASAFRFMTAALVRVLSALMTGLLLDKFGLPLSYILVGALYVTAVALVLWIRSPSGGARAITTSPLAMLNAGIRYAVRTPPVRDLLLLSLITETFGFSYIYMLPIMARDVLQVGPAGLGYLTAASALGQLAALLALATLGDFRQKGPLLLSAACALGLSLFLFAWSRSLPLSLALIVIVGGSAGLYDATISTILQIRVDSSMRGRILGIYVATFGSNQVGGLGLGAVATVATAPVAMALFGAVVIANTLRLVPHAAAFTPGAQGNSEPKLPVSGGGS